jgi:hypothetical protein
MNCERTGPNAEVAAARRTLRIIDPHIVEVLKISQLSSVLLGWLRSAASVPLITQRSLVQIQPPQPAQAPEIPRDLGASRFCSDAADPAYSPRSLCVRELGRRLEVARVHADTASGARGDRAALAELLADNLGNLLPILGLDTLILRKKARIVTGGNDLVIYANKIVSEDGTIVAFDDKSAKAANATAVGGAGAPGVPGGTVTVIAVNGIDGILHVDLSGQVGGNGAQAAADPEGGRGGREVRRPLPAARHQRTDVLSVEGEVPRPRGQ